MSEPGMFTSETEGPQRFTPLRAKCGQKQADKGDHLLFVSNPSRRFFELDLGLMSRRRTPVTQFIARIGNNRTRRTKMPARVSNRPNLCQMKDQVPVVDDEAAIRGDGRRPQLPLGTVGDRHP
jgi:hypothetical protein